MIFSKCKILLVLQLSLVFNCFAQLSDDFNRDSLESGLVIWNQGLSSGMTGEFLIESNELRAVFDNGSGTRAAYISTEIHPDLQAYTLKWNGKIKLDFSNLSSSLVSKNLGTYYLMSDKLNLLDNPYGFFLEFKLVPAEDSLTCELMFESSEGKTELQFENQEIKFKAQEYLSFEVTRNPDGDWKVWINDHYLGRTNFPLLEIVNAAGLQIQYSSGSRENKFFMDDFSLDYNPFFDSLSVSSPNELELFCKSAIDSPSVFILENYFLNDSINPEMVSFDNEVPEKIKLHFSSEFIPDYLNTLSIKEIKDENGYEISEERPQNLIFTYSQPDLSPPEIFEISGIEKNRIIINFNEAVVVDTSRLQDIFKILETENQIIQFQVDSLDSKKLKLSFQYEFKVGNSYTLKVSQLADAEGNIQTGQDANFVFSDNFPPGLEKIEVLSGKSLKLIFSEPLDELQANQNTNYQELISELIPELALLNKENPKEVFLYFNQELAENKTLEIQGINLEDIFGNQIDKAISQNFIIDTKKPSINTTGSIFPINQNQLELHFTESLTIGSANILNNYEIKEDIGFPSLAIRDSTDYSIVHLFFEENLGQEKVYDITIRNVSDLSGNVISTKTRSFILDQKAPELVDLRVFSIHELKLFFSESLLVDSAMLSANYWVNQGLGNPDSIFIYPYNTKVAHLFFENSLPEKDSLLIEISNLEDHYGNVLIKPDSVYFNTKLPSVAVLTVLSDKMLEVKFSKKIDKENLSVLISGGIESPKNVTYQKTDSSTLIMELNGVLTEDSIYTINLENVSDFSGNIKLTIKKSFIFNPIVEQVEVVESNVINLYFEEELHPEYPLKNTDYSLNSQAIFPLLVFLDQENHQLLTLVFEENFPADKTLKLLISPQMKKDGEFSPESNINFIYDLKSPEITKIEAIYNELTITFSEPVEKISATALNHYWINEGVGNPIDFDYQNDTTVSLFFKNNFEVKNHYSLTIESVEDMAGNTIPDTAYNFKIYPNPRSNQLIITEIMADPSPVVGLPDTEYIEVWNVTEDTFNLAGMKLVDATGETGFPNFLIYPNDYVILCASGNFSQFMALGKTLSLISFPSLNNSGEILKIISPVGKVINEVNYTDDWYGNPEKTDGGWSLEIIDPFNFCSEKENWKASENSLGGTPGEINSLMASNPDTIAPKFLEWVILNDSTVNLVFSERMDTVSLLISENYEISGEMDFEINLSNDVKSVELVFSGRLEKGKNYQITLADLADKCGNYLLDFSFDVILPEQPAYNEIIVTEIFADPNPSVGLPEFEYLEIYNSTDKTFDLGDLKLEVGEDQLKMNTSILQPFEYVVLTSNSGRKSLEKYGRTIGITNWIALKNTGDQIVLRNKNGELIFEITYQDDWYADIDKEDGGFSLEMKNVTQPCLAAENWEASENAIGGTPGSENSLKNDQIRDDFPPELQKGYVIDELNIQLIFDGKLDSFSVVNALTKLKPEIGLKKLIFDYQNPKEVRLELESPLIEKIRYRVGIKDLQDCSGNTNVNWQYLILVLPEEADSSDILISEVLFNPPVGGIDFVEIYNNSDKHIDLKNWMIGNGKTEEIISEKPIIIAPNNFLTLTSDISQLKTQHPVGADSTFFETKLPSFNDKEGMVILKNSSGNIIDEFSYHEDFHNSALDDKNGVSLERINYSQPTNTPDNWTSAAETIGFATPGYRNSQHNDHQFFLSEDCFEVYPQVIIPDLDGIDDYAILNYGCLNSGSLATIIIYDAFGREIKSILNNQLIPVDGQFIWDGTNRQGQKVSMGNYIIQISLIEANGTSKEFRKNVAVGTRF